MSENYYEILELTDSDKTLNEKEFLKKLKSNYRRLSKLYHPDMQQKKTDDEKHKAEELFKKINYANDILSDKDKRQKYDQFGPDLGANRGYGSASPDINDFINNFMGNGFGQQQNNPPPINITINISLIDIFNGTTKKFKYKVNRSCSHCHGDKFVASEGGSKNMCASCHGTGFVQTRRGPMLFNQTCPTCGGIGSQITNGCKVCHSTGVEKIEETVEVNIPKGVPDGSYISFAGKGNEYLINGKKVIGDLFVYTQQIPDEKFTKRGNDLHCYLDVSIYDCLLGESVTISTIDNKKRKFNLKIGTNAGEQFRLTGLGMPIINTSEYGDLFVHVKHIMPTKLNEQEIELINKLKNIKGE